MTSQREETQPLLREASDVIQHDRLSRRNVRNMVVAYFIIALFTICAILYDLTLPQFVYARMASEIFGSNFTSTPSSRLCVVNTSDPDYQKVSKAQALTADKILQFRLALAIPSLFTTVFIGAYSDHLGRRVLFFSAIVGIICQSGVAVVVEFFNLDLDWMFLGYLLNACCGGIFTIILATYAYIADNTPANKSRTLTIALSTAFGSLSLLIAYLGGGYLIQATGFFYPFLTTLVLLVLALVVTAAFLEETNVTRSEDGAVRRRWPSPLQAVKNVFGFYFSKSASAEPATEYKSDNQSDRESVYRRVQPDRRLEYCLGIVVYFFSILPGLGLGDIDVLYLMNQPFCWDSKTIGIYDAVRGILQRLLSITALKVLSSVMREEWIGVMGIVSVGGGYLIMAFASHDWMLYVASAVGTLASLAAIVIKSLMSQRAPSGKQGSLFASMGVLETVCYLVGGFIFNSVYSATVDKMRGATFLLTTALTALGTSFMLVYVYIIRRNSAAREAVSTQRPGEHDPEVSGSL